MNLDIRYVPSQANKWTVTRKIAEVLHSEDFRRCPDADERPTNFQVQLNDSSLGGVRNNGTGILTLPSVKLGHNFLRFIHGNPIQIDGKKIKFYSSEIPPQRGLAVTLEKTPYINPDIEEERQQKLLDLQEALRVDKVQFGVFYRSYPQIPKATAPPRAFSIECELNFDRKSLGWLRFEYDHKLIRIELGDPMTEQIGRSIAISFSSISKLAVGYDGNPFLCFDTLTPPVLEEIDFNRPISGDTTADSKKYRRRIGALHPSHAIIAPYAHQLRIVLYNDPSVDVAAKFTNLCKVVGLSDPFDCKRFKVVIDADHRGFYTEKRLYKIKTWLKKLDWFVAFQLETALHNALLNTDDLLIDLYAPINNLCRQHPKMAGEVLRHFNEGLQSRPDRESPLKCFERILHRTLNTPRIKLDSGLFLCHHVTFTPTRMILEGPYATQSNRVIRSYEGFEENFLRVDFRDEDRLQYRWTREVDAISYLKERVGGILKSGFELAGKDFEFLAYSSSALREHAVWFMHPFQHPKLGWVTSNVIRSSLGNFKGVIREPSKYAARMAQAFTATYPSVTIRIDQWDEIDDIQNAESKVFTDGVGTISKELGDLIWQACSPRRDRGKQAIRPSVYQIRFLGYKGVVGVDEQLEGIKMCLRPSMNKFKGNIEEESPIEIVKAFGTPGATYLNRSLIMVLEDRGVRKETFHSLQEEAVAGARTVDDSIAQFQTILTQQKLGHGFRLNNLMKRLNDLGLGLNDSDQTMVIKDEFQARLRRVAMNHVLRDIKHHARIPLPRSYQLVGIADEGPAYQAAGYKNVYILEPGQIYVCIQKPDDSEPTWLKGQCMISRSPVVHPGDVQHVRAIGKPPDDKLCLFSHMKNVVVFPAVGSRPLPDCLAGGDLDGDTYDIVQCSSLLAPLHVEPATYTSIGTHRLDRESTVDDICDFIVEYINSDVLGLLSIRHLIIADQSKYGTLDDACLKLAKLCSQAVDYPKNGIAVDIENNHLPSTLIRCKPDWQSAEVEAPRGTDYYESSRALGELYRSITLSGAAEITSDGTGGELWKDNVSLALKPRIEQHLSSYTDPDDKSPDITQLFRRYTDELQYICATHTLSNTPGVRLSEEEVVVGTILAKCSQKRWRSDRIYRMGLHTSVLVQNIQRELLENLELASTEDLCNSLDKAWRAWAFSVRNKGEFGSGSFGLIALDIIFECLDGLED